MKDNIFPECFETRENNFITYSVDVNKLQCLKFDTNNQSSKKYTNLVNFNQNDNTLKCIIDNEKIKKALP